MRQNSAGNNKFLKEFNQAILLDLIRIHKGISKADLAKMTGLSPTAAGVITASLLEKGYIHETGTGESKGGRRPVLLELKPHSFFSIGIDMDVDYMNVLLIDITGEILFEKAMNMPQNDDFEKTVTRIEETVISIMKEFKISHDKLLGIGISIPGIIDSISGKVVLAPNLGWSDVDLPSHFNRLHGVPVKVENEAMASAICEGWVGACQGIDNFVCINIRSGIGAGIYTHGKPYRGVAGSAGEIGHIVVDENGPKCGCGNYGCVETMASTGRIVEQAIKVVRQGSASCLNLLEDIDHITIDQVTEAARNGDEEAGRVLAEAARYLGIAISSLVNTLNPEKVVIGKDFVKYADLVLESIKSIVARRALQYPASRLDIVQSSLGEKASALGAAIIPLKVLFGRS
ncbi:MAG: ROK family transcriptional regulator [Clostridia bacterium]|nr:ROK family transcriptional regulator [Clostridia bacterium]